MNLKKKLIILGGSHDQIGTIQKTNSMNINSIVFDKNYDSPGKKLLTFSSLNLQKTPKVSQILQKKLELMECFYKDLIFRKSVLQLNELWVLKMFLCLLLKSVQTNIK